MIHWEGKCGVLEKGRKDKLREREREGFRWKEGRG